MKRIVYGAVVAAALAAPMVLGAGSAEAATGQLALKHTQTGMVMTVSSLSGGSSITLQPRSTAANTKQLWIRESSGVGARYRLAAKITVAGGRTTDGCLDLPTDVSRSQQPIGAQLVVRECDGTNTQKWTKFGVQSTPSAPKFRLSNVLSAMSADRAASNINGLPDRVVQRPDSGGIAENGQSFAEVG